METNTAKSNKQHLEEFIHENLELEKLEEIANEFNFFTALNIVDKEIRPSNFFSWLMDPNESHGLGDYFLSDFLKKVSFKASSSSEITGPSIFEVDNWNLDDAEVIREWKNIDMLIISRSHKFVCAIENKILSKLKRIVL